jgi:hypothetical protein
MYTFIREVTFKTMADAVRAKPITDLISKYYKDTHKVEMRLMRPIGGSPIRLRFVVEMQSLDAWAAMQTKAIQDPAFQKLLGEIGPTVDGGKTYDEIWQ